MGTRLGCATAFVWEGFGLSRNRLPKVMYADFETTKKMDDKYQVPYCIVLIEEFKPGRSSTGERTVQSGSWRTWRSGLMQGTT
jgi:hypothetical protein